jgi:hypothetical protein
MATIGPKFLEIFERGLFLFMPKKCFLVYEFLGFLWLKTAQTNYAVCFFCLNCQSIRDYGTDFTG